jgi:hypothetical protein
MNWLYSQAIGGVKVQVRAEDAEFAKKILGTDESASLANIDVGSPKDEKCCVCKRCGSANITLITQLSDLINYFILRCLSMPRPWVLVNEE